MKRILLSLSMIAFVGAIAAGATGAWFSDTETSTGNTFTAGSLDLKIDSRCHYFQNGVDVGCWHPGENNTPVQFGNWEEDDLGVIHKFFWFDDIKPGDWGENTISLHVYNNDAWGRMHLKIGTNKDNDCTEPEGEKEMKGELDASGLPTRGCDADGELYQNMTFMTWLDQGRIPGFQCRALNVSGTPGCLADPWEGDNIWQDPTWIRDWNTANANAPWKGNPEPEIPVRTVPEAPLAGDPPPGFRPSFFDVFFDVDLAMKSQLGDPVLNGDPEFDLCRPGGEGHYNYERCHGIAGDGRLVGSVTYYIGWMWKLPETVQNEVQTDSLMGDMMFEAIQHRNNPPVP